MIWSLVKPSNLLREVWTDDPSYAVLTAHARHPPATGLRWPELP